MLATTDPGAQAVDKLGNASFGWSRSWLVFVSLNKANMIQLNFNHAGPSCFAWFVRILRIDSKFWCCPLPHLNNKKQHTQQTKNILRCARTWTTWSMPQGMDYLLSLLGLLHCRNHLPGRSGLLALLAACPMLQHPAPILQLGVFWPPLTS